MEQPRQAMTMMMMAEVLLCLQYLQSVQLPCHPRQEMTLAPKGLTHLLPKSVQLLVPK
jgi:hypothetical protein